MHGALWVFQLYCGCIMEKAETRENRKLEVRTAATLLLVRERLGHECCTVTLTPTLRNKGNIAIQRKELYPCAYRTLCDRGRGQISEIRVRDESWRRLETCYLFLYLFVYYLFIYLYIYLFVYLFIYLFIYLLLIYLFICLLYILSIHTSSISQ